MSYLAEKAGLMKIAYLLNHVLGRGGTIATTIANANVLADRGHDVEIVSVVRRVESGPFRVSPKVSVVFLTDQRKDQPDHSALEAKEPSTMAPADERRSRVYSALTDRRLQSYLAQADGVVVGTRPALNLAVSTWTESAVRVGQEHVSLRRHEQAERSLTLAAMREWYPGLDALVTLTTQDADDYRRFLPDLNVSTIPNAVHTLNLSLRSPTTGKVVITAGRLTGAKGFDRLISAYARIAASFPDWNLWIYGSGPAEAGLRRQVQELEMGGSIHLPGFSEDLPQRMSQAGIFAMTSHFEGLPMVMLEAMGVGLSVVAYDCGSGSRDLISTGYNGFLVSDGAEEVFADSLSQLMRSQSLRETMGARSLEVAGRYEPSVVATMWEDLFEQAGA